MFEIIPIEVLIPFGFFGLFLFYQSMHHSSGVLLPGIHKVAMSVSIVAGALCNIAFLIYFGVKVVWWAPLVLLLLFIPFLIVGVIVERIIGRLGWALLGFIGWPICAYLMFSNVP